MKEDSKKFKRGDIVETHFNEFLLFIIEPFESVKESKKWFQIYRIYSFKANKIKKYYEWILGTNYIRGEKGEP